MLGKLGSCTAASEESQQAALAFISDHEDMISRAQAAFRLLPCDLLKHPSSWLRHRRHPDLPSRRGPSVGGTARSL